MLAEEKRDGRGEESRAAVKEKALGRKLVNVRMP